jgi:hypothetical protein
MPLAFTKLLGYATDVDRFAQLIRNQRNAGLIVRIEVVGVGIPYPA